MEKKYWQERWEQGEIGFHQQATNPYLCEFWPKLNLAQNSEIFVPLCGKSRDMVWLREQGHSVLGVEFSLLAAQAFFREYGHTPYSTVCNKFTHLAANDIHILWGDFFNLSKNDLVNIRAVYDRAALIALPPEMRKHYVHHLLDIIPPDVQILLITLDYRQAEMSGPPFSVSLDEVIALYQVYADIELLAQHDILEQNPRFQERGLSRLQESVFILRPHVSMPRKK
jgi:thiopurine S-methyltransferase